MTGFGGSGVFVLGVVNVFIGADRAYQSPTVAELFGIVNVDDGRCTAHSYRIAVERYHAAPIYRLSSSVLDSLSGG